MTEKRIDFKTLMNAVMVREHCKRCDDRTRSICVGGWSRLTPDDCPIWAGLEDVGDLRSGILKIIDDWEPRESGHVGIAYHLCQELRNLIDEPGCSCDDHNVQPPDDREEDEG